MDDQQSQDVSGKAGLSRRSLITRSALVAGAGLGAGVAGLPAAKAQAAAPGTSAPPAIVTKNDAPDVVILNGKISTVDASNSTVEALAIRDGEIIATGGSGPVKALAQHGTLVIDLHGRRVLPGLIDGHLHGLRNGHHCFTRSVRLDNVLSRAQALELYSAKGPALAKNTWIFTTGGWTVNQLDKPGMFTISELREALPDNPVFISGSGASGVQVNSRALQVLGLGAGSPGVEVDSSGNPTGRLTGPAITAAGAAVLAQLNELSIDQQADCLADFIRSANSLGLTAWNDPEGNELPFDTGGSCTEFATGLHDHQPVIQLNRQGRLNARVTYHLMNNFSGLSQLLQDQRHAIGFMGDDMLRYLGIGEEVFCPGDQPPPDPAQYQAIANFIAANRMSFENHASSDATQVAILNAWEKANDVQPLENLHWTIAHPGNDGVSPTDQTLARVKALGVGMTPGASGALGTGHYPRFRSMYDSGIRLSLGSDAMNVAPYPPFVDLWYVVSGNTLDPAVPGISPDQRLTREQALRAKTVNGAWNLDQEGRLGTLEVGKHADLIVLSDDYFTIPADDIRTITSLLTIVAGKIAHASGEYKGLDE
ncbi:MAG: amidohydrolase family protein [Nocardiopsaceae bacterium]|jgi:predicted amidohydrolase YtcJ|nr:amidohydrolase family protein [Nocardiopsaceae bacterium]